MSNKFKSAMLAVIVGSTVIGAGMAHAAPPIYAQDGPPEEALGTLGQIMQVRVKYKLMVAGNDPVRFGREPLDIIFTAPPGTFSFISQSTVMVVNNTIRQASNCQTNAPRTELMCKIEPQANALVSLKGDIEFRPMVQMPMTGVPGSKYVGGSVLNYQVPDLLPPGTPSGVPVPVVTASVNYVVGVR